MRRKVFLLTSVALMLCLTNNALAELVAHWQFEGDFTDATGNGHDGTAYGDPTIVDDPIRGQVLEVDGDDRIGVSDALDLNYGAGQSLTLAAWVNFEPAGAPSGWKTIVVKGRTELGGGTAYVDTLYGFWVSPSNNWHVNAGGFSGDTSPAAGGEWHHLAFVQDGALGQAYFYIDGEVVQSGSAASCNTTGRPLFIGAAGTDQSPFEAFKGRIDDVQIYSHAMLEKDIREIMEFGEDLPQLKAWNPNPADGAEGVTTQLLQWTAGETAVLHDVYFGTNPSPGPAEFIVRQSHAVYYAASITPGTTYYWRIDEVEADGTTIHTGDVWTFTAVSLTAYRPNPPDGAIYVSTDVLLSWRPGANAVLHDVYLGTDEAEVTNGTGDTFKATVATTAFQPEPLTKNTTYYWRIDEFDGITNTKGQVWSFTTMPIIPVADPNLVGWWKLDGEAGTAVIDWSGHDHHGVLVGAPQWVPGYDGGALEFDGVDDHVEVPHGPDLAFGTSANYTVMAWVNLTALRGQWAGIVTKGRDTGNWYGIWVSPGNEWVFGHDGDNLHGSTATARDWHHLAVVYANGSKTLYLDGFLDIETTASMSGDNTGRLWIGGAASVAEYLQGKVDDARVYNKALTEAEIWDAMRGDPRLAWDPIPADRSTPDIERAAMLSWKPGEEAAQHDVYLGTDETAVKNADTSDTTGIYRGQQAAAGYAPPEPLAWGQTYYWRVDEVNTDATISVGRVWSFTVAEYLIVDDFEDYDDYCNRIFYAWKDGWGHSADPACEVEASAGNGTGSTVGNLNPPFAERNIVHSGGQSMPFEYNNTGAGGKARYSEAQREWAAPQDWTRKAVKALTLYFYGDPANAAEQLYVALQDNAGQVRVVNHPNLEAVQRGAWQEWNIALTQFSGANLKAIKKLYIGLGNRVSPAAGGSGKIYIDDIRLYRPRCVPSLAKPAEDLSDNCIVDYADIEIISDQWLNSGFMITPTDPGNSGLIAYYPLNGNANDVVGAHNGTTSGIVSYTTGKVGQAILLDGVDDMVTVGPVGISGAAPRTISCWAKANSTAIADWTNIFGFVGPSADPRTDMSFDFEIVGDTATTTQGWFGIHVYGWEHDIAANDLDWHHLAASYDGTTVRAYGDGRLTGTGDRTLATTDTVQMGKRTDYENYFPGRVDEARIFNRVLSESEIAWLAGHTSAISIPADLHQDDVIDFKDFAVLADAWLDKILWP